MQLRRPLCPHYASRSRNFGRVLRKCSWCNRNKCRWCRSHSGHLPTIERSKESNSIVWISTELYNIVCIEGLEIADTFDTAIVE